MSKKRDRDRDRERKRDRERERELDKEALEKVGQAMKGKAQYISSIGWWTPLLGSGMLAAVPGRLSWCEQAEADSFTLLL